MPAIDKDYNISKDPEQHGIGGASSGAIAGTVVTFTIKPVDKQGALPRDAVTLSLGAADPGEPSLAHFVEALHQATGGRIRVDVDRTTYYSETRGGPGRLAPALTSGEVDLALIPSRDWAATGDPGFVALQAPFLVASTAATTTSPSHNGGSDSP